MYDPKVIEEKAYTLAQLIHDLLINDHEFAKKHPEIEKANFDLLFLLEQER